MELMRIGQPGHEIPVIRDGERHLNARELLTPWGGDFGPQFWEHGVDALREADLSQLPELNVTDARIGAPVASPGSVICIGTNYAAHAAEAGMPTPTHPVVFLKTPNTVAGPNDELIPPRRTTQLDWEVELALIIGTPAHNLESPEQARDHIAAYAVANDFSERVFQTQESGGQWSKGKCFPGALPLGPVAVTAEVFDPSNARLTSRVNGEPRQDSSTSDMVFDVYQLVYDLSQYMRLDPGYVIATGTPQGVAMSGEFPFLAPGDVVETAIEGLGSQRTVIGQPSVRIEA